MFIDRPSGNERIRAVLPVIGIHALMALALLQGLASGPGDREADRLTLFDVAEDRPPPPEEPPPPPPAAAGRIQPLRQADPRPEGAASPPNLVANPTPVVAPDPIVPTPTPQPLRPAPIAGTGTAPSAGAAPIPGPGTGSGGTGTGTGSGRGGDGAGGGGGGGGGGFGTGRMTPPRQIRGRISIRDLPAEVEESGGGGVVSVRYAVEVNGRVTNCVVLESSGSRALDQTTCRLIEQRFVFEPSRDATGRPIRSQLVQDHHWEIENLPPEPRRPRRRGW